VSGKSVKYAKQNVGSNSYIRVSSRISVRIECFGIQETLQNRSCWIVSKEH